MTLSKRLNKIIEMTPPCQSIADIGTDHGYVPCGLLRALKIKEAIASDVNHKPLEKAVTKAEEYGLVDSIDFRLGSGLTVVSPNEVQGVIIAGMGGQLTKEILEASLDVTESLDFILLQPAQGPAMLRRYLYGGEYEILKEDLIQEEDGRFYEYFLVRRRQVTPAVYSNPYAYIISPWLIREKHPLLHELIAAKITEIEVIQSKLDRSFQSSLEKDEELNVQKNYYKEVLSWL